MVVKFIIHISQQQISIKLDNMREIDTTFPTLHLNIETITGFSASLSPLFLHIWFKRLKE